MNAKGTDSLPSMASHASLEKTPKENTISEPRTRQMFSPIDQPRNRLAPIMTPELASADSSRSQMYLPPFRIDGGPGMFGVFTPQSGDNAKPQDRPFKCEQCPQSFNRNHDLKRHRRIHLAVRPFPCSHCEKSFSRRDALKVSILRPC